MINLLLLGISIAASTPTHTKAAAPKVIVHPGILEGVVTSAEGTSVWTPGNKSGVHVTGVSEDGRHKFDVESDTSMGGLYRVDKIWPGYYDVKIAAGYVNGIAYQPQLIYAVHIADGQKTALNVTMARGETLNVTGTPVYSTPAAAREAEDAEAAASTAKPRAISK